MFESTDVIFDKQNGLTAIVLTPQFIIYWLFLEKIGI